MGSHIFSARLPCVRRQKPNSSCGQQWARNAIAGGPARDGCLSLVRLGYLQPRCHSSLDRGLVVSRRRHWFNSFLRGVRGILASSQAYHITIIIGSRHKHSLILLKSESPKSTFHFTTSPPLPPDQHKKEIPIVQAQLKEKRSVVVRHLMEEKKILCSLSSQKVQAMGIVGYSRRF